MPVVPDFELGMQFPFFAFASFWQAAMLANLQSIELEEPVGCRQYLPLPAALLCEPIELDEDPMEPLLFDMPDDDCAFATATPAKRATTAVSVVRVFMRISSLGLMPRARQRQIKREGRGLFRVPSPVVKLPHDLRGVVAKRAADAATAAVPAHRDRMSVYVFATIEPTTLRSRPRSQAYAD
jgi:hypothetical protein